MSAVRPLVDRRGFHLVLGILLIGAAALVLHALGHPWISKTGILKIWGVASTPDNSQELFDWYSLSHVIHGLLFYAVLHLLAPRWPLSVRALTATLVEVGWEVLENTPLIINRYREATISLDYFGDSVINSVFDVLSMLFGFWLAGKLPVWASVILILFLEALAALVIRDGLILNILMLVYPLDAVRAWQAGG
ncbi:MAG: DUF2585 family protein [Rhizobiales bacterium]|nr:DUF2585 family protein [Hyphomicrobiales bacterium]